MATLATVLDRMARYEPAATIAGFASTPFTVATYPELLTTTAHLRTALGDQAYESLARKGEAMTTAAMATYAYDQIDQAGAELNAISKWTLRQRGAHEFLDAPAGLGLNPVRYRHRGKHDA